MGRKVHPIGFRLGYIKDWQSKWFADRTYTDQLHEDILLRKLITKELANAGVARVDIERAANRVEVTVFTAKPGIVIGKRGAKVDELKADLEKRTGKKVKLNIQEIHQPELEAQLVAESIAYVTSDKPVATPFASRFEVLDELPAERHDEPVDGAVTPTRTIEFPRSA